MLASGTGFAAAFNRGSLNIYSGTQPATADAAITGTLLGVVTIGSAALTQETPATGTFTVTGGSTSILTATIGTVNIIPDGPVLYNASVGQTASDLCDAINRNGMYSASVSGAVVSVRPRPGAGSSLNGLALASTGSVTITYGALAGGTNSSNGLTFGTPSAGTISKSGVWSFNGLVAGTAGWFRLIGSAADGGALNNVAPFLARLDGSIATSGADLNLSNIVVAVAAPNTIDTFTFVVPAQ